MTKQFSRGVYVGSHGQCHGRESVPACVKSEVFCHTGCLCPCSQVSAHRMQVRYGKYVFPCGLLLARKEFHSLTAYWQVKRFASLFLHKLYVCLPVFLYYYVFPSQSPYVADAESAETGEEKRPAYILSRISCRFQFADFLDSEICALRLLSLDRRPVITLNRVFRDNLHFNSDIECPPYSTGIIGY